MRVRLTTNVGGEYLKKANEIRLKYKDKKAIERYMNDYNPEYIILEHNVLIDEDIDWKWLTDTNILLKTKLILCLNNIEEAKIAKKLKIKFYFDYPITSFFELQGIVALEPVYIKLGAPLFFMLDKVKKFTKIPIIAIPNIAYSDGLPHEDGLIGTWIRPEDIKIYEKYIDIIEFENCDKNKQEALYRIYIKGDGWHGELKDLITNLNYPGNNRLILPSSIKCRLNCGQKCLTNNCHICEKAFNIANAELVRNYKEKNI